MLWHRDNKQVNKHGVIEWVTTVRKRKDSQCRSVALRVCVCVPAGCVTNSDGEGDLGTET